MWSNLFANLTVVGSIHAIPPTATGVTPGTNVFVFSNVTGRSVLMDSSGKMGIGTIPAAELDVSGNVSVSNTVFIGNTFWTGSNSTNSVVGPATRLVFDNTTTSYAANKILLHSNTASANICGFGVVGVYDSIPMTLGYYTSGEHSFTVGANQNFGGSTAFTIRSTGSIDMNGNKRAKLDIGTFGMPSSNTTVRIDGSNVALVTSGSGLVGFGTTAPTANLHVIGNIYASNAITTTNVFATQYYGDGGLLSNVFVQSLANLVVSNSVTTTNVFATTANVGTLNVWQVSNLSTLTVTNNLYAANAITTMNLFATGNTSSISNMVIRSFDFVVAATAGSYSNVCSIIDVPNGSAIYAIYVDMMARGAGGSAQTKTYIIVSNYNATSGTWTRALPIGNPAAGGQTGLDVMTLNGTTTLRVTNRNAAETVNIGMVVKVSSSSFSRVVVTDLTSAAGSTGTGATFSGFYPTTLVTQVANRVGVSIEQPTANLHVAGNVYVSNAVTTTNVFATTVTTTNPIPFRNRLINGAMNIWQRNVASISTTTSVYTTADRWCGAIGTSGLILSQWPGPTEAPQFPYSLQVITSTATSGTPLVEQRIENQNIPDFLTGTPVTVSFYASQNYGTLIPLTVGLYYATAVNNFGTQTLAVAATQNTPTITASNVYYSLSFTLNTSLGATNGLALRFSTGGASAIGSTFLLTGVQVEKGAVPTPFEFRPYTTELALAQRYYYQLTSPTAAVQGSAQVYAIFGTATGITTAAFWLPIQFPVTMRTPNYTFSNSAVSNFQLLPTGTTTITSVGLQTDSFTSVGATLNFVGTNITVGGSYIFRTNNLSGSTTAFFGFSCEL
jgi:hypothetical protein